MSSIRHERRVCRVIREPIGEERRRLLGLMAEAARDSQATRREILEDLFWGVLTGREFLFNH